VTAGAMDNQSGSHFWSQVKTFCQLMVFSSIPIIFTILFSTEIEDDFDDDIAQA